MVEVFTDPELSLDRILSFADSKEFFKKFMTQEKALGEFSCFMLKLLTH